MQRFIWKSGFSLTEFSIRVDESAKLGLRATFAGSTPGVPDCAEHSMPHFYGIIMTVRNFHLPLPEITYAELRAEAEKERTPATTLAREAISDWLRARKRAARQQAVMDYASEMAGTRFDVDPDLEAAAVEHLMKRDRYSK